MWLTECKDVVQLSRDMEILLDASALLAVILGEREKPQIVAATVGYDLISPACLDWEVGNALSATLKQKRFDLNDVLIAWNAFQRVPIRRVRVDFPACLKISSDHNIYAYDAYYLQSALYRSVPLLTLDDKMKRVATELGVQVAQY